MGLVHVDYATQARTIKASGEFYREVVRANGANVPEGLAASLADVGGDRGAQSRGS
jgi:hypothetical protein